MNIPEGYLARDFERARTWWGPPLDAAERRHGIPHRLLYAVWSRETNLGRHWDTEPPATWPSSPTVDDLTYFIRNPGDSGHGHGGGQVDDRSHAIPGDWATNIEWQVDRSAEILGQYLAFEGGDIIPAANRYNSGQPDTARTTGKDYGPDVAERHAFLLAHYPPETSSPPRPKEIITMLIFATVDGNNWFAFGGINVHVTDPYDLDTLTNYVEISPSGVPKATRPLSAEFLRQLNIAQRYDESA